VLGGEALGVGRVADLAVQSHDLLVDRADPGEGVAVGAAGRDLFADLVGGALDLRTGDLVGLRLRWRMHVHPQRAHAAQLLDRRVGVLERLAVLVGLVLDRGDARALLGAGEDHGRAVGPERLCIGLVDCLEIVAVDLLHVPAAGLGAGRQRGGVPLVHGRAALAEPVDVDDGNEVVEAGVPRLLEGLPHRSLGELGVAAEHPDPEVRGLQPGAGERDSDRDRQPLAERAGGDVDPGDLRGRMTLQARAEFAEGEELLVVDRAGHLVHAVEERRGVALGEDEMVVRRFSGAEKS